jgi:uncharacterized cupredoxin-like copper-binding protein
MTRFRIGFLSLLALSASAVLVWALPAGAHSTAKRVTTVNVSAGAPSEFKFSLSPKKVSKGIVTFKVKNVGQVPHDFKIGGRQTKMLNPGQSATLRVTFLKAGKYPYLCTVPTHATLGMKGVLTVS